MDLQIETNTTSFERNQQHDGLVVPLSKLFNRRRPLVLRHGPIEAPAALVMYRERSDLQPFYAFFVQRCFNQVLNNSVPLRVSQSLGPHQGMK